MAITSRTIWITSDGQEFTDQEEANRWESAAAKVAQVAAYLDARGVEGRSRVRDLNIIRGWLIHEANAGLR